MNTVLWVLQAVLAAVFLMAGLIKTTQPKDKLVANMPMVEDLSLENLALKQNGLLFEETFGIPVQLRVSRA